MLFAVCEWVEEEVWAMRSAWLFESAERLVVEVVVLLPSRACWRRAILATQLIGHVQSIVSLLLTRAVPKRA
jgi:hypothetical protein